MIFPLISFPLARIYFAFLYSNKPYNRNIYDYQRPCYRIISYAKCQFIVYNNQPINDVSRDKIKLIGT
jgi:hypothetical protein